MDDGIYTIVEDMKKYTPKNPIADSDIHTHLSIQMARLFVLLAEASERHGNNIAKQTEKIIRFTKAIVGLTWALFFIGIVQIIMVVVKS